MTGDGFLCITCGIVPVRAPLHACMNCVLATHLAPAEPVAVLSRREQLAEQCDDEELLFLDGFDDCIVGICTRFGQANIVAYDLERVVASLQRDGMSPEEAAEHFAYNVSGGWVGERTPCFVTLS